MFSLLCGNYWASNFRVLILLGYIYLLAKGYNQFLIILFSVYIGLEIIKGIYAFFLRRRLVKDFEKYAEEIAKELERRKAEKSV
jgi:hypothetical protein